MRRIVAHALLVALAAAPAAAQPSPELASPERCDRARLARALGVSTIRWSLGCLPLDPAAPERWLVAAARQPDDAPARGELAVVLAVVDGGRAVWREEVRVGKDAAPDVQEAIGKADDRFVWIEPLPLGTGRGARVGVSGQWGRRDTFVREIALVLRLPAGAPPRLLWSGVGNARESRAELCRIESFTQFRLVDERTLERATQVRATFDAAARGAGVSKAERRELQKRCVAPDPQPAPQRFPIAP